jgi:hypothetical protein
MDACCGISRTVWPLNQHTAVRAPQSADSPASRLTGLAGYRWLKFTLVNEPDEKVSNELFAGLRWRLD